MKSIATIMHLFAQFCLELSSILCRNLVEGLSKGTKDKNKTGNLTTIALFPFEQRILKYICLIDLCLPI